MKKILLVVGMLSCMIATGIETAHAQQARLDDAIQSAATTLSAGIDTDARIAILAMQAGSVRMSNYLINEMIAAFVGVGGFTVVNRAQLDLLAGELHFSMSGYVDDATAQSVGRFLGVQSIVTGTFESLGGFFRFRVQVVEVETAIIRGMYTADVQGDAVIAYLQDTGQAGPMPTPAPPPLIIAVPEEATYNHFTAGQRLGTWFLNGFIPGLGSFVIMGDRFGGWFQLICGGAGWAFSIIGIVGSSIYDYCEEYYSRQFNIPMLTAGAVLMVTHGVFNIIRSRFFMRNAPSPRIASVLDPDAWNIAIASGGNGIERVSLIRTLRF